MFATLEKVTRLSRFGYLRLIRKMSTAVYLKLRRFTGPKSITVRQVAVNNFQMLVRVDDSVGSEIYYLGAMREDEADFIARNIEETDICFDIGANVGYYTLLLASLAKKGQVHSFEPVPLSFHLLQSNIQINSFGNVVANCCAVGEEEGERPFAVADDTSFSSFVDTERRTIKNSVRVSVTTLDTYCREHKIQQIHLMKVDVEGAEGLVLNGARQIMQDKNRRPRLVMLELYEPMLRKYGTDIEQILHTMAGWGYDACVYHHGSLVAYREEHYNIFYNVLFVGRPSGD